MFRAREKAVSFFRLLTAIEAQESNIAPRLVPGGWG
jgi:hypothetical protein